MYSQKRHRWTIQEFEWASPASFASQSSSRRIFCPDKHALKLLCVARLHPIWKGFLLRDTWELGSAATDPLSTK